MDIREALQKILEEYGSLCYIDATYDELDDETIDKIIEVFNGNNK